MTFKFLKMVLITCRYAMCISLGVLSVSGTASATLIESIAALEDGAMYRVLFVTNSERDATSPDINDYNEFVSAAAINGSLTGSLGLTWKALASTAATNAQVNTEIYENDYNTVTMFNTFGDIIANSGSDLWDGTLSAPINGDEDGLNKMFEAWTGTDQFGGSNQTLGGGTVVTSGATWKTDSDWVNEFDGTSVNFSFVLYGTSNVVTKPLADVPEPGTVILLSLGLAGLSFARYRKQS
jgi:hypothetical protein